MVKVLVCGSRYFEDWFTVIDVLDVVDEQIGEITHIISGGAKGADYLGKRYATVKEIPFTEYPADWETHGRAAGPIRNKQMLVEGKPDVVVAFDDSGAGTRDMIRQSYKVDGLEVLVVGKTEDE
jgi:hypothetical protein